MMNLHREITWSTVSNLEQQLRIVGSTSIRSEIRTVCTLRINPAGREKGGRLLWWVSPPVRGRTCASWRGVSSCLHRLPGHRRALISNHLKLDHRCDVEIDSGTMSSQPREATQGLCYVASIFALPASEAALARFSGRHGVSDLRFSRGAVRSSRMSRLLKCSR